MTRRSVNTRPLRSWSTGHAWTCSCLTFMQLARRPVDHRMSIRPRSPSLQVRCSRMHFWKSWNRGKCTAPVNPCRYAHRCNVCSGSHRASPCPNSTDKTYREDSKHRAIPQASPVAPNVLFNIDWLRLSWSDWCCIFHCSCFFPNHKGHQFTGR